MWAETAQFVHGLQWKDWLDFAIVATILYGLFLIVRGSRALHILIGLGLLALTSLVSRWADLTMVGWIINSFWSQVVLVVVVLFQPEIRRALARIGLRTSLGKNLSPIEETRTLEEIIRAVLTLVGKRVGAIFVLERRDELKDIVELGVSLKAKVSKELLISLFMPQSPLHDGAIVIRGDRIMAAGCFLPLTLNPNVSKMLGTRHRAALGVTEETDAVVITVSEETGKISVILGGRMIQELDGSGLRETLTRIFLAEGKERPVWRDRFRAVFPVRTK
jgi:diadenylate cyclase